MKVFPHIPILLSLTLLSYGCENKKVESSGKVHSERQSKTTPTEEKVPEIEVMELQKSVFHHEIVSNGKVTAHESVDIAFKTQGIITSVYVRNGQRVNKGQRIAALDTYKLENQLAKDKNAVASAKLELQDVLIGQGYNPDDTSNIPDDVMKLARLRSGLEQAELSLAATERDLEESIVTAPISGVVANLKATPHSMTSSDPLCRIINDGAMDVEFQVLENELALVRPGDSVVVSPFSSEEQYQGYVAEINPMVDVNGMVRIWATIKGGKGLMDGMNVRVKIQRKVEEALVVPKSAVVLRSGRQVVFNMEDGKAKWNYITTGLENLDSFTVTEGLAPGMKVITSGNMNLAHDTPVVLKKTK